MASIDFINECKNPAYENRYGKLYIGNGDELNQSNVIQNFTIDSGAYNNGSIIGSVYCKKLNAQLIDSLNKTLENESITAQVGVKYNDNTKEYINLGKYNIEKPKDELTDNYTSFVAYDDLANKIDKVYVSNINYSTPKTLGDLYQDVCINLDLVPKTTTFLNSDIPITNNPFTNKETNRFVLETICKIAASYVDVDVENNKIDLVWLSDNEEPDYTFLKSDYSTVNGGKVIYGPVNSLTIRSTSVESENVTINDTESIEEYGEHSIIIADDYILNTPQLRQQALTGIWNRLHNLQYVDCELTTLTGKPFLKIGKKIRIYTSEEEYFDTYVLQHEFTYDGTFKSVIKSPAMTEQEVAIKQEISLGEKLSLTSLTVDKQNQTIQSVVSNVGVQDEKISQITQTVNEINSKISDIADITTSAEDTDAVVELNEINTSEPIQIKIHPTGTNISYLYPSTNLYPSEDLYMRDRRIRFHNTTTDENFDFILPDDLLYYDSEHYDEFLLDYGDGTPETQLCQVTKRCKYNADGTVSLLSQEEITNYTYPSIPLTDGDYEVSIYGYQQGYIFTRLMAKNIYTTQFYTKVETNTLLDQTATSITASVNQTLSNYSTTSEMNAQIQLTAQGINTEVAKKVGNDEIISKINQSAEQIQINADKISLAGKEIDLTSDNIAIQSTYFNVDKYGNMTANSGTFGGTLNTSQNCIVGNDLYVGQNQVSTTSDTKKIQFTDKTYIERTLYNSAEWLKMYSKNQLSMICGNNVNDGTIVSVYQDRFQIHTNNSHNKYPNIYGLENYGLILEYNINNSASSQIALRQEAIEFNRDYTVVSDKRNKKNIKDVDVNWLDELKVKEYQYKDGNKKQIGLIAQDYLDKDYSKYFLDENENGYYSIRYGNITNALIKYCQEMNKKLQEQQEEIEKLKEMIKNG